MMQELVFWIAVAIMSLTILRGMRSQAFDEVAAPYVPLGIIIICTFGAAGGLGFFFAAHYFLLPN